MHTTCLCFSYYMEREIVCVHKCKYCIQYINEVFISFGKDLLEVICFGTKVQAEKLCVHSS